MARFSNFRPNIMRRFFKSKHVLKVYFKPSRKNKDFLFLPDPDLLVRLKILHLTTPSFRSILHLNLKSGPITQIMNLNVVCVLFFIMQIASVYYD